MQTIDAIESSPVFTHWRGAFREVTGIDIHLLGGLNLDQSLQRAARMTELCRLVCGHDGTCAACRQRFAAHLRTAGTRQPGPYALRCMAGLTVAAVAFPLADGSTGFLRTDPTYLRLHRPVVAAELVARRLSHGRPNPPREFVRQLARAITVRERRQFNAAVALLGLLAAQLAHLSRQMLGEEAHDLPERSAARRCREIIDRRFADNLHIDEVAHELGVSRSYLSHLCSRCLGLPFTDYLTGKRVAELKRLLGDSALSITEAIFAAGFQSISQANRVFRRTTGMAPREFRARLKQIA
jgi:AraC-like DNA-binding protein